MICVDAPGIQLQFFRRASKNDEAPCASYAKYSLPGVCLTMNNGQIADTPVTVNAPGRQVIPVKGPVHRWIEPWYLAYAILGALASGWKEVSRQYRMYLFVHGSLHTKTKQPAFDLATAQSVLDQ